MIENDAYRQLAAAGYLEDFIELDTDDCTVFGTCELVLISKLRGDTRFIKGGLHSLHPEVGEDRIEFRSHRGEFGKGSLQIVLDKRTGKFHADVDAASPYDDVVGFVMHAGEVIRNRFRKWFS